METTNDKQYNNLPTSNDLYEKAKGAIRAGVGATAAQYVKIDKSTTAPNAGEKALHGDDMASQGNMGSEKQNTPN